MWKARFRGPAERHLITRINENLDQQNCTRKVEGSCLELIILFIESGKNNNKNTAIRYCVKYLERSITFDLAGITFNFLTIDLEDELSDFEAASFVVFALRRSTHVYVDDPGQWMLGVGAALDGDAQNRLGLFHGDSQITLMIGHHQGAVLLPSLRHLAAGQPLHAVMPSRRTPRGPTHGGSAAGTTLLQQLRFLHVEAPRKFVRELLEWAQLAFERR
ncbi:hypothetical protein DBV15_09765 [Temnothorax longispinosus]|uniref:Uncharacterized protein n=1 Tax=Temnothorax longispinosus TaxID=300112 RepID=A0A4S2KNM8_9HYME|nr:hypothetical protein DBV15_09765 [Temnothorax longispinosus]